MSNYNNTVIYMIYKPDSDLNTYVGHTTNFKERVNKHRVRYNGKDFPRCNLQLYDYMRENGQFDDWKIEIITEYPCNSKREAEKKEQHFIDLFKSVLNSKRAYTTDEQTKLGNKLRCEKYKRLNTKKVANYQKKYQESHKEEISLRQNKPIKCDICGDFTSFQNIIRHKNSKKCKSFIYNESHKEEILLQHQQRGDIKCDICGVYRPKKNIVRHQKSIKCQSFIK